MCRAKNPAKLKISDNKDLNNFVTLNRFKVPEEKAIDKKNQHGEEEDLISRSPDNINISVVSSLK